MNRFTTIMAAAPVLLLAASNTAFAHGGNHAEFTAIDIVNHFTKSPFHLAPVVIGGLVLTAFFWRRANKR
ncbi:MAG: hypothetical protein ABJP66_07265 [Hyphomicrobiales bacterium]